MGLTTGSVIGPTKPDAFFKARSTRAQFGVKSFVPLAGLVHETEAGSSNGGLVAPSSSKLQRSGSSTKEVMSIVHSQESSKLKGPSVSARRKARSWSPSLKVSSFVLKRNLEGGGSSEANRAMGLLIQIFFPTPLFLLFFLLDVSFFFIPLESSFTSQCGPFSNSPVVELSRCAGVSCSEDVAFPLETSNQNFKDCHFLRESLSNPEELCVSGKVSSSKPEPPTL